jgi:K(+)-stimulated pyrophosphate-energized sodium pump
MTTNQILLLSGGIAILSIGYSLVLANWISKQKIKSVKAKKIAELIQRGARAYLSRQYRVITIVAIILATLLYFTLGWVTTLGFLIGAIFSALSGYIGMAIATKANVRTAEAAGRGLAPALVTAFRSGSVMGFMVVGFGLLVITGFYLLTKDVSALIALGFGGSFIALFARVGGGIYTKAADVGADLVGKIEQGIPEDDPRNPAVIADNVGDNVGDVSGMGADLYESYVDSIVIAMILGAGLISTGEGSLLPLLLAGAGIVASIIGTFFVSVGKRDLHSALNRGIFASATVMVIFTFLITNYLSLDWSIFYVVLIGLVAGIIIGLITEYYTSEKKRPTQEIARSAETGAATNIIAGLSLGMMTTLIPIITISVAIISAFHLNGLFGIALAAVGMLSTLGITLATDTYGPVADNAAGIAEMAGLGAETRERAEQLDAVGNTTAAIGKGFAIGSAALTALALFAGYSQAVSLETINVISPTVMVGLLIGATLPFIFSSLTMKAVGQAAFAIVQEVRSQFKSIKGLMAGQVEPDYQKCIEISTSAALKEMVWPSLLAIFSPIAIGWFLGPEALGGLLAGVIASGFLLAIMMANAGGAWDNAKKYIEAGNLGGKGSKTHQAAVVGDTVGDPFKDTSGPSLNILIKLVSIVALLIAPVLVSHPLGHSHKIILLIAIIVLAFGYWIFSSAQNIAEENQ